MKVKTMEREFRGLSGRVILHYAARIATRFGFRGNADPFHFVAGQSCFSRSQSYAEANCAHRGLSETEFIELVSKIFGVTLKYIPGNQSLDIAGLFFWNPIWSADS
jgi:hypothetical protein